MKQYLFPLTCLFGALAILWVALATPHASSSAGAFTLIITLAIALVYGVGVAELIRFRRDTRQLEDKLTELPDDTAQLDSWIIQIPAALQQAVYRRIHGEGIALPGPSLTPYLAGLLVMLGLLGTFIGLLITLQGTVTALEGSSELQAMRSALLTPISGLSLAFGTSISGVAASAMLGLAATLCRRDRLQSCRHLDHSCRQQLPQLSRNAQQQTTVALLQSQQQWLPELVDQIKSLGQNLQDNQTGFFENNEAQFKQLAASVGQTLDDSLVASSRKAAESIEPVAENTLKHLREQVQQSQEQLHALADKHLSNLATKFQSNTEQASQSWQQGLASQQQSNREFIEHIQTLIADHQAAQLNNSNALLAQQKANLTELVNQVSDKLSALNSQEQDHNERRQQALQTLEKTVSEQLAQLGQALEAPMTRLIETASETPKAAADVISQLRKEVEQSSQRDNELLAERQRIMSELDALLGSQRENAQSQRETIETLVSETSNTLKDMTGNFAEHMQTQQTQLADVSAEIGASAADVASLSEAFSESVGRFAESNDTLLSTLEKIEQALEQSATRSDEQLAYYVEQAREVIDLSMSSQKDLLETMSNLQSSAKAEAS